MIFGRDLEPKLYEYDAWYRYLTPKRLTLRTNPVVIFRWLWFKYQLSRKQYEKYLFKKFNQVTYVYCPHCGLELISSKSECRDEGLVYFKCANCGMRSKWDFDMPTPLLLEAARIGGIDYGTSKKM